LGGFLTAETFNTVQYGGFLLTVDFGPVAKVLSAAIKVADFYVTSIAQRRRRNCKI